jgi:hypothetical protein
MIKVLKMQKEYSEAVHQKKYKQHNDQRFEYAKGVIRNRTPKEGQTTQ